MFPKYFSNVFLSDCLYDLPYFELLLNNHLEDLGRYQNGRCHGLAQWTTFITKYLEVVI